MIYYLLLILLHSSVDLLAMEGNATNDNELQLIKSLKKTSVTLKKDQNSTVQFLKSLTSKEKRYLCNVYSELSHSEQSNSSQYFWQIIDRANESIKEVKECIKSSEVLTKIASFEPQQQFPTNSQFLQDALVGSAVNALDAIRRLHDDYRGDANQCVVDNQNIIIDQSCTYNTGSLLVWSRNQSENDDKPLSLTGHRGCCYAIAVTDKYIIETGWGNEIFVWDKIKQQEKPLLIWKGRTTSKLLVHNNWLIAGGADEFGIVIYDLNTLTEYKKLKTWSVNNMRIENNLLYVATQDNGIFIFDLDFNQKVHLKASYFSKQCSGYFDYIFFATREHNGFLVATSCDYIILWKLPVSNNAKPYAILPSNVGVLWDLEAYKNLIIVAGKSGTIELWDINNLNKKEPIAILYASKNATKEKEDPVPARYIRRLWISPEGLLFSASNDGLIKVWSLDVVGDIKEPIAIVPTDSYFNSLGSVQGPFSVEHFRHGNKVFSVVGFSTYVSRSTSISFATHDDLFVSYEYEGGSAELWNISSLPKLQQLFASNLTFLEKQLLMDIDNARKKNCTIKLSKMQRMVLAQLLYKIRKEADSNSAKGIKNMLLNYIDTDLGYTFSD